MTLNQQVILHISDLHFSTKCGEQGHANRKLLFDGLLSRLKTIEPEWRPTLVCVTGDITDKGQSEGFDDAADWLNQLSHKLNVDISRFLLVPGNHDCVRDTNICLDLVPDTQEKADNLLKVNVSNSLQERFKNFSMFCKKLGIPPYKLGDIESYLVGNREVDGIQFIGCNTAWFSWKQNEQGKLWLGYEILRYLESNNQLVGADAKVTDKISIALMHHGTDKFFHPLESEDRGGARPPALGYLWKRSHLALYGHSHENALDAPNQMKAHCWVVRAGATNVNANYPNNVNLIRLSQAGFELRTLEFDPADTGSPWNRSSASKYYPWPSEGVPINTISTPDVTPPSSGTTLELIRERAINYAAEVIINKSRQIKPHGSLPEQISLQVTLKPESESDTTLFSLTPSLDNPKLFIVTLDEAVFRSRLTLLFGDLGAGKSTLLAKLAIKIGEQIPKCLPLFIPAVRLAVAANDGADALITKIDTFMANDLNAGDQCSFKRILDDGYELLLLADGLDEIDKKTAVHLLRLLTHLPEVYSRVTVVLSSRFSEMAGVNFERWQACQVLQVASAQKEALFKNEALAQGVKEPEAIKIACNAKFVLENNPSLNAIANTPLAIRLLYPSLAIESATLKERTLGDLLYDLLLQRLGGWAETDVKSVPLSELEEAFPTAECRAIIVGELAFQVLDQGSLSRIEATAAIKRYIPKGSLHADLIVKQYYAFLEDAGIIVGKEQMNFVYQPLAQISAGVFLAEKLQKNITIEWPKIELWRVVSFAGTMIRRMNCLDDTRGWFSACIAEWMKERRGITPSCYVCDELHDNLLAKRLVELFLQLKRRPLWYLEEERAASTQAVARTLVLAGEKGFDWLYSEYLDPRMPPTNSGSAFIGSLYGRWALLIKPLLTPVQQQKLTELVPLLLATSPSGTHGFLECLAYLVPDAFEQTQYLWVVAGKLDNTDFYRWAKEELVNAFNAGAHNIVNSILERKPGKEGTLLWFDLNREKELPTSILKALLSAKWSLRTEDQRFAKALADCQTRIGNDRWCSFLRWCLTDLDQGVAASAALELLGQGENSFYLLGDALSKVLDTGGIGNKAEIAMRILISQVKDTELNWVACLFGNTDRTIGARAGSWRILLETLNTGLDNGPELLLGCIDTIGPYNIPRNPDIRLSLQTLLTDKNGQAYRKTLRNALNHHNPIVRHAAAMILVVSCPGDEGLALITAVSFVGHNHLSEFWEWEKFLITLNFGPSVLESLSSALNTFNPKARNLGLALLSRHGIYLSESDIHDLLCSNDWHVQQLFESIKATAYGLTSNYARNILIQELESRPLSECKHIAESLLKFHKEDLSQEQQAKCFVATINDKIGWWLSFDELIEQINSDASLFSEIVLLREKTSLHDFPKLVLHMIGSDGGFKVSWDELLWDLFCSDNKLMSHREDDIGLDLFWIGQKNTAYGKSIGNAALNLLDDERIQKHRWTNHYHWLAVLADEFVGLDKDKLMEIASVGDWRYNSASYSLLRRIGEIPTEFDTRDRHNSLPKDLLKQGGFSSQTTKDLRNELLDAARESELLKSNIETLITRTLLEHEVSQQFLDELATKGINGCLIAGVLAFCCGLKMKADYAISFISYFEPPDRQNSPSLNRLKSVAIYSQYALTRLDAAAKNEYVSALFQAIKRDDLSWKLHYIYELLRLEKGLTLEQIEYLLPRYAQGKYYGNLDRQVVRILSEWVSNLADDALREKLLQICPQCMESLDKAPWDIDTIGSNSPSVLLFFSLLYWCVGGDPDEKSRRIFARAIKLMFHHRSNSNIPGRPQQYEVIESVSPLLSCVLPYILRNALEGLLDFPESEVRMWINLFRCFADQQAT